MKTSNQNSGSTETIIHQIYIYISHISFQLIYITFFYWHRLTYSPYMLSSRLWTAITKKLCPKYIWIYKLRYMFSFIFLVQTSWCQTLRCKDVKTHSLETGLNIYFSFHVTLFTSPDLFVVNPKWTRIKIKHQSTPKEPYVWTQPKGNLVTNIYYWLP